MTFLGKITEGRFVPDDGATMRRWLTRHEGKRVQLEGTRIKRQRTNSQNAYYWQCLTIAAETFGYTTEELHHTFAAQFLTDRSGRFPVVRSTTGLTTVEFMDYIAHVVRTCAEFGCILPLPEGA